MRRALCYATYIRYVVVPTEDARCWNPCDRGPMRAASDGRGALPRRGWHPAPPASATTLRRRRPHSWGLNGRHCPPPPDDLVTAWSWAREHADQFRRHPVPGAPRQWQRRRVPRHRRCPAARHTAATLLLSDRAPSHGRGAVGPQPDAHDDGRLQPRGAGAGRGGRRADGVLRMPGVVAPTATRDESGRPPGGERPARRGGTEGTRTPDPHTARPS